MSIMICETRPSRPCAAQAQQLADRIPVLETRRLVLRAPRLDDFSVYAGIACAARGKHLNCATRADAWYDFSNMVACWLLRGHGIWTITARGKGDVLGFVLLGCEPGDEEHELGFMLTAEAEGRGIAAEAAEAARAFGFEHLGLTSLVSYIDPDNTRSAATARRICAFQDGQISQRGDATSSVIYRHPRPEDEQ